jgi:V/A-type H+-transporting ATPase subunit G/H
MRLKPQFHGVFGAEICLSGIEAVRKIVETEAQAKRIIEDAKLKAKEILESASAEAQRVRQTAISSAEHDKVRMLKEAREKAEADARSSDEETSSLLENYKKLFENKKEVAVKKAVELILGS